MNLLSLSWNYLRSKPLNTLLNVILMSLGLSIILVLMLASFQLKERITKNAKGVSLVVGAKGSPLQLILCNVYHIDFPTGNISLEEAIKLSNNSLIKKAIPLALGDSYRGFRLVGTNEDYLNLFEAQIANGDSLLSDLKVILGTNAAKSLGLKVGDTFLTEHGMQEGGMAHEEHSFMVSGILESNNSVIDNLIISNVESIWMMHEHDEEDHHHDSDSLVSELGIKFHPHHLSEKEITSLIIQYAGPMGAVRLPRYINKETNMQAASPAFETARLFNLIGFGVEVVNGFAFLILGISALSIFIALYNSLKERKYDLAIMRSMGASRAFLLIHIIIEGLIITVLGGILSIILAHGALELIGQQLIASKSQATITGFLLLKDELIIIGISFVIGIVASILPAIGAYRSDISKILAEG